MWIQLGNVHSKLTRFTPEERAWLNDYLSFPNPQAHFSGGPDRIELLNSFNMSFPAGFVPSVHKAALEEGFQVDFVDGRVVPCVPDPNADLAWLYDYQSESVRRCIDRGRGILWLPTGAGKTEVAVGLVRALPCRWLFVVNSIDLMDQAARRFETRGLPEHEDAARRLGFPQRVGRIGEGLWQPADRITCATFQTLSRMLSSDKAQDKVVVRQFLQDIEGVLVDECHTLPANTFMAVLSAMTNAYFRFGVSGTPLARGDRKSLYAIGALGPVIQRVKPELLIGRGILSKPKIRFVKHRQAPAAPTYQGVYGEAIVRSTTRNALLVELAKIALKPSILFVKEVSHGKHLEKALLRAGMQSRFVWGTHPLEFRKRAVRDLVAGRLDIIVASAVFYTGIDIPELASGIVGSGGKSVIQTLQRLGRAMRTDGGRKMEFEWWDIHDEGHRHLEAHSRARLRSYVADGYDVETLDNPPVAAALAALP